MIATDRPCIDASVVKSVIGFTVPTEIGAADFAAIALCAATIKLR
jgi:hypothetical protein